MASFDWIPFLESNNVRYVTSGPNVGRGHVGIKCPFCSDDPSEHMSISIEDKGWGCWRSTEHRGKSPVKLIQGILRCSYDRAAQIAGRNLFMPEGDILQSVQAKFAVSEKAKVLLRMPDTFKPFKKLPSVMPFANYLRHERRLTDKEIFNLTVDYDLLYCTTGSYRGRIIFPIFMDGILVTWTGRTIYDITLRYKTLPTEPDYDEEQIAVMSIRDTLLWYDRIKDCDADTIFLCEGPFDSLMVSLLGRWAGIVSTCFFTNNPSDQQIELLHELLPKFRRRYLLLDRSELVNSIKFADRLAVLGVHMAQLSTGVKDPGNLSSLRQIILD